MARMFLMIGMVLVAGCPALAACPGPLDLRGSGVVVTLDDNSRTTYRLIEVGDGPAKTREDTIFDGGASGFTVIAVGGVLVLESYDTANGLPQNDTRLVTRHDSLDGVFPITDNLEKLVPGQEIPSSGPARPVKITLRTKTSRILNWAGCDVAATPMTITYVYEDGSEFETLEYLPQFGIAVYVGGGVPGETPDSYQVVGFGKAGA